MMTQFDCISSRTERQTNNLASEKREGGEEEREEENGRGVEDRCLDEGQVFEELRLAINRKEKRVEKKKRGSGILHTVLCTDKT